MKKSFLLVFFLLCTSIVCSAQNIIKLKNGSIIRGQIVERTNDDSIKIERRDGTIITVAAVDAQVSNPTTERSLLPRVHGYYGHINVGSGIIVTGNSNLLDLQIINGYQFNTYLAIGVGFGFKTDFKGVSMPIFFHIKSDFLRSKITPYAALNVGYNANLNNSTYVGFYIEPTIGVSFRGARKSRFNLAVGYSANKEEYRKEYSNYTISDMCGVVRFSLGVTF